MSPHTIKCVSGLTLNLSSIKAIACKHPPCNTFVRVKVKVTCAKPVGIENLNLRSSWIKTGYPSLGGFFAALYTSRLSENPARWLRA